MLSTDERDRLLSQFERNPPGPLTALVNCAAGILALVIVAAGPWLVLSSDAAWTAAEQPAFQAARSLQYSAMAESKRIFDERRQRYEAGTQGGEPTVENSVTASMPPESGLPDGFRERMPVNFNANRE